MIWLYRKSIKRCVAKWLIAERSGAMNTPSLLVDFPNALVKSAAFPSDAIEGMNACSLLVDVHGSDHGLRSD